MTDQIRVAIAGYGNLVRGVEASLAQNSDMELICVFSRRDSASVTLLDQKVPVYAMADVEQYQDEVDVMILCGGSKTDTGTQSKQTIECSLALGSKLEFTASALVAYTRAVYRLARSGEIGVKTVFDVAPGLLSPKSPSQLRKELL